MFNRFEVSKDIFVAQHNVIFDRINQFKHSGYKQVYHIIIPNIDTSELGEIINNIKCLDTTIRIYNEYVSVNDKETAESLSSIAYISSVSYLDDINLLNRYYTQCVEGWSALYPTTNLIIKLNDNLDMVFKHNGKFIGNLLDSIDTPNMKNVFIGEHGKCSKCLNCMCDVTQTFGTIFLMKPEECRLKSRIKDMISKEVKEVTKEEYGKIMEAIAEIHREMKSDHNIFAEIMSSIGSDGDE